MDLFFTDKYGSQLKEGDEVIVNYMGLITEAIALERVKHDWVICKIKGSDEEQVISRQDVVYAKSYSSSIKEV